MKKKKLLILIIIFYVVFILIFKFFLTPLDNRALCDLRKKSGPFLFGVSTYTVSFFVLIANTIPIFKFSKELSKNFNKSRGELLFSACLLLIVVILFTFAGFAATGYSCMWFCAFGSLSIFIIIVIFFWKTARFEQIEKIKNLLEGVDSDHDIWMEFGIIYKKEYKRSKCVILIILFITLLALVAFLIEIQFLQAGRFCPL